MNFECLGLGGMPSRTCGVFINQDQQPKVFAHRIAFSLFEMLILVAKWSLEPYVQCVDDTPGSRVLWVRLRRPFKAATDGCEGCDTIFQNESSKDTKAKFRPKVPLRFCMGEKG